MLTQILDSCPLIENKEDSIITFADKNNNMKVYDFDFKSFADQNPNIEHEKCLKTKTEIFDDKMSTNDEDEDLQMLVSLLRVPAKTQRRNSWSLSEQSPFEFEFLNLKRDYDEFQSVVHKRSFSDISEAKLRHSDRNENRKQQMLEDSIDEAIMANNVSIISFDADLIAGTHNKTKHKRLRPVNQSKNVKSNLYA